MPTHTRFMRPFRKIGISGTQEDIPAELVDALAAHAGLIIRSAARVLGNIHDAEDIAQDIAEKLLRSPPADVRSWPAFLKTMAINRALDRLRRRKDWADFSPPHTVNEPEAAVYDEQRADVLRRAIAGLPERDGQLFALYYLGDLTHADIGRRMNMTANAVGVSLHRLRGRLTADVRSLLGLVEGEQEK
jgi:RNA polymerase sigma factor (sigma-70 family)